MATNLPNYYKALQVDNEAETEVIEVAYKRLALKYHPDVQYLRQLGGRNWFKSGMNHA